MANRAAVLDKLYGSEPLVINAQGIELINLMNWYNMNSEPEDRRKWIVNYAKNRLHYDDADLSLLSSVALQMVQTIPYCARAILKGSTFEDQSGVVNLIDKTCKQVITKARDSYNESQAQREQNKLRSEMSRKSIISEAYWNIFDQLDSGENNIKLTVLSGLTIPEIEKIKSHIEFSLEEYKEAKSNSEGYEKINLRSLIKRLEKVLDDMNHQTSLAKARKKITVVRKRKPVSAAKQVSKLHYSKEVDGFKSINPEAILTASVLFVYDEKTRRMIKFANPDGTKLTIANSKVKAHTITSKTVRKPSLVLTEMRKGTIKTAERVYEDLTTKEQVHSGRVTDKCLILRVNAV